MASEANTVSKCANRVVWFVARVSYDLVFDRLPDTKLVRGIRSGLRALLTAFYFLSGLCGTLYLWNRDLDMHIKDAKLETIFDSACEIVIATLLEAWLLNQGPYPASRSTIELRLALWLYILQTTALAIVVKADIDSGANQLGLATLYDGNHDLVVRASVVFSTLVCMSGLSHDTSDT